ncbi:hypothetical protein DZK34_04735 [Chlamydia abortus]|nr:hypothetical protein DZK34_04735 [Chlamydia abortus]
MVNKRNKSSLSYILLSPEKETKNFYHKDREIKKEFKQQVAYLLLQHADDSKVACVVNYA